MFLFVHVLCMCVRLCESILRVHPCLCFFEQLYRVPPLKQIQQEVMLKDGPRETPQKEGDWHKCQINSFQHHVYLSEFTVTHTGTFLPLACGCLHLHVYVISKSSHFACRSKVFGYFCCFCVRVSGCPTNVSVTLCTRETFLWLTWGGLSATAGIYFKCMFGFVFFASATVATSE